MRPEAMQYYGRYAEEQQQWYEGEPVYCDYPDMTYNKIQGNVYVPELGYPRDASDKYAGRAKHQETEESKTKYKISLRDILCGKDIRTTLMIKNIPNKYNQKMLLQKIDMNHKMQYNFFYLPIDFKVLYAW